MVNPSGTINYISNSRDARNTLREVYGRYILGKDLYPTQRVLSPLDEINPRVRPVAKLLEKAWATIDLDNVYFWDMTKAIETRLQEAGRDTAGLVVAKVGLNAAQLGKVSLVGDEVRIDHGIFSIQDTQEIVNGADIRTPDGNTLQYVDGRLTIPPVPDLAIIRDRPDGVGFFFDGISRAA